MSPLLSLPLHKFNAHSTEQNKPSKKNSHEKWCEIFAFDLLPMESSSFFPLRIHLCRPIALLHTSIFFNFFRSPYVGFVVVFCVKLRVFFLTSVVQLWIDSLKLTDWNVVYVVRKHNFFREFHENVVKHNWSRRRKRQNNEIQNITLQKRTVSHTNRTRIWEKQWHWLTDSECVCLFFFLLYLFVG